MTSIQEPSGATLHTDSGIATITLCSTEGLNTIGERFAREVGAALRDAHADPDVRAIVVRADGPAFCAGGALDNLAGDDARDNILGVSDALNDVVRTLHRSPHVTVASVQGPVVGGGIGIMLACDLVIASEEAFIVTGYSSLGLTPDLGVTHFLVRDVGYRRALDLCLRSERVTAREARDMGLITRVVAADRLDGEVEALVRHLGSLPPSTVRETKRVVQQAMCSTLDQQLDDEIRTLADLVGTTECRERITAFLAQRRVARRS